MMKKLSKRFLAMFMSILLLGFNSISTMAADKASVIYDTYNNFSYNLIRDNSKERIISYMENDMEVMIIYNKSEISLTIIKKVNDKLSTEVYKSSDLLRRDNSSIFSPWEYSSSGTKYTLTAVIDGKTVSKTVNRTTTNSALIDSFCNTIDDIRDVENDLIIELGFDIVGSLIAAAFTGGIGLGALLTAIGASANALANGERLNKLYDRAAKAYKDI